MRRIACIFLSFLLLGSFALAATQTQRPTGDLSGSGTWNIFPAAPATYYDKVNEAVADDDSSYIYCATAGRRLFSFPAFSIPAGATVSQLSITYRHKKIAAAACNIRSALQVGGTIYETTDPGVDPTNGVWNTRTYSYANNPDTAASWTVDQINGVGANALQAFGVRSSDATPDPYVTQVYAEVTYTVPNSPPIGGYTADNVIPAAQCVQAADGSGLITISFRVKDANLDPCTLKTFQYSTDGGAGWSAPTGGDASGSLSTGWTNNNGSNYSSAVDFSGTVYSFTFNTKHADVSGINGTDQSDIRIRFTVNDGSLDSTLPATSDNFQVDDLNPAALTATDVSLRPQAGDTSVTLTSSFTEAHPNTNTFSLAVNGGAYGAGSAGDSNTASPAAHATPAGVTLDGNDYISKVRCVHVDDFGNAGTNENLAPGLSAVKPYTPAAPTVSNPSTSTVDVVVNKNASETAGLEYAINVSSHNKYVQADGSLGDAAAWQTIAAWGTKTVTGLSAPVNGYVFKTKSRNPNGDQQESDLSGGSSSANTPPQLHDGTTENRLVVPSQATDRSGKITFTFRIKDIDLNPCSAVSGSFQYQVNGGGWNSINDADITGTKTGLASAADMSGPLHTLVWDTSKEYIDNALSTNVQLRFQVNDGASDSTYGVSPLGFSVDNLDPAPLAATDIYTQPRAGFTTVTLSSSFTETNPNTNTFYAAINGGDYGSGTAGESNTATPAAQATAAGATLDGNDYVNKVKCVHVDDFGNIGSNENTSPDSAEKYVKPYTPATPTAGDATESTLSIGVNKDLNEVSGLEYAIYVSSHNKYVQADGSLGSDPVWQTISVWGTKTVSGLSSPVSDYYFETKSRNPSDLAHQPSSESELSDPANSTFTPPTPEVISYYYPAFGAEGVSPEVKIEVRFDRDMDIASVTREAFSMKAVSDNVGNTLDQPVSGSFSWPSLRSFQFTPSANLGKGYTYRVSLIGSVKDFDGNTVSLNFFWTFRVISERLILNTFTSSDQKVQVVLSLGAVSNDVYIDINRNPTRIPTIEAANNKVLAEGNRFFFPIDPSISDINAYGTDDVRVTGTFEAPVTVILYYSDENNDGIVDGVSPEALVRGLRLYWLDETNSLWVKAPNAVLNASQHSLSAVVKHFSVYTLMATPASSLSEAIAFPNPFKPSAGHTAVTFSNLSSQCTIKIFTLTGDPVKTIVESDGDGKAVWDVKNDAGEAVASGLYLYVIESADDVKRGKLVIIK